MTNETLKKLIEYYGSDDDAIIRKLGDLLNITQDEAGKILKERLKKDNI